MTILVIRFSSLGDVAIAAHVVAALRQQYPQVKVVFLTKKQFRPVLSTLDITVETPDLMQYKGFSGLGKLAKQLSDKYGFERVFDLHGVLRSWILDFWFVLKGKKVFVIDKGKREKRQLVRRHRKKIKKLKHTAARYANVFTRGGLSIDLNNYRPNFGFILQNSAKRFLDDRKINIGIAPFAAHRSKEYPPELMREVLRLLDETGKFNILIFGGGKRERQIAEQWQEEFPSAKSVIGQLDMQQEIALIGALSLMVTMDSGNMHLASLTGTKTITIWGGTHPHLGFTPFKNFDPQLAIQKDLPCRPCSVFGTDKCYRGDFACLRIEPEVIFQKIVKATQMSEIE